ncbi:MAG TPA: hypothetical protein VIU13_01010 [Chryseolinea sp.]
MNTQPNLKEALIACVGFSIIGFFNLGLNWEERTAFVENITWELQSQLTLSKGQALKIMEINYEFYDAVSDAQQDSDNNILPEQINRLIIDKNRKIMNVLNKDQQREWLQSHLHRPNTKQLQTNH